MANEENTTNFRPHHFEDDNEETTLCINHHSLPDPDEITKKGKEKKQHITLRNIAGVAGNVLEWYDFALFGNFSDIIGNVFFPPQEGNAAIIESFTVFGTAFLFRPVGAMVIGYIGDKYGKKKALEISILLMAVPTFALGCLPPFSIMGYTSTVLLILIRIFQGLSVGGQIISSLLFTLAPHPKSTWGYYGSFVFAGGHCGSFVGGLVGWSLREYMDEDDLISWGWRLPFLSGIVVAFPALYLKFYCEEDEDVSSHVNNDDEQPINPIVEAFKSSNRRSLVSCILVPMLGAAGTYLTFTWLPIYMNSMLVPPIPHAFGITSLCSFFGIIVLPLLGTLSDKMIDRNRMMIIGGCSAAVIGPFMILLIGVGSVFYAFVGQAVLSLTVGLWVAPMGAWLAESFPENIRLTAVSIGFNIALGTVGGFSPAIATLMVDHVGISSPGILYTIVAIYSLIGLLTAPKFDDSKRVDEDDDAVLFNDVNDTTMVDKGKVTKDRDDFLEKQKPTESLSESEDEKQEHTPFIKTTPIELV